MTVVVIGEDGDPHVEAVRKALAVREVTATFVSVPALVRDGYVIGSRQGSWIGGVNVSEPGSRSRGWIRRFAPASWREPPESDVQRVERAAWLEVILSIAHLRHVHWLTDLPSMDRAENKITQMLAAERAGAAVPAWSVSDRPPAMGQPLIVKPLGPGEFWAEDGTSHQVFTAAVPDDEDWDGWGRLAGAPFILQRRVEARKHYRVLTVAGWACAARVAAPDTIDWRRDDHTHSAFQEAPDTEPGVARLLRDARSLAASMDLGYSSQDWIWDGETYWFVDMNPAGQWLFLPHELAQRVTDKIASWLAFDECALA